jgi:hypothetical protein
MLYHEKSGNLGITKEVYKTVKIFLRRGFNFYFCLKTPLPRIAMNAVLKEYFFCISSLSPLYIVHKKNIFFLFFVWMKRSEKEIKDFFGFFSSDWVKPFL